MHTTKLWILMATLVFSLPAVASCGDDDGATDPVCGDGVAEGNEVCDGNDFAGAVDCGTEGFAGGAIGCTLSCTIDTSGCDNCGDGIKDADEDCDGDDLGTATCESLSLDSGDLACTTGCTFDETNCEDASCTTTDLSSMQAFAVYNATDMDWVGIDIIQDGMDYYWIWYEFGSAATTGSVDLGTGAEVDYLSCVSCVSMDQCTDPNCDDVVTSFFATSGTLNISALGTTQDATFTVSLSDLVFTEWDLFGDDIPVADGECLMDSAHTTDATVSVVGP